MARKYVELHARSAFSFLRGASFPEHLAERAAELELPAVALCDRDGVYGAARFYGKGKESGTRLILGAELTLEDGAILPVLVESRTRLPKPLPIDHAGKIARHQDRCPCALERTGRICRRPRRAHWE